MEEKESESRVRLGRMGWGGISQGLFSAASCERCPFQPSGNLDLRLLLWLACQTQAPTSLPVALFSSPQGSPGKAEARQACLEHFRAAMTPVLVPKINAPQTRQCGQGLRSSCKYQLRLPISAPRAPRGQALASAFPAHSALPVASKD